MKQSTIKKRLLALTALMAFSLLAPLFMPATGYGVAYAQNQTVQGVVKDSQGEPLIGAGVLIKGTGDGTVTDSDGKFTLSANQGQVLVISYIGFVTKEVAVDGGFVDVVLPEDNNLLDEVVVIGYGTLARKDISSSIATISSKDFNTGSYTSPAQLLQGKVAGLTVTQSADPSGSGSISLRGASSLREGSAMEPYYIIDGVPGISLSLISPDDIETIDVLRDASATAIYGSKAANGVIIVTTKKGSREGRVAVNYSGYASLESAINLLDVMNREELLQYAATNGVSLPNDEGCDTNWQKEVLRTGFSQNHNISISGGSSKAQYNASINYYKKDGVVRTSGTERLTARSFVQAKGLNDHLEVSASVNASVNDNNYFSTSDGGDGSSPLFAMYYFSPLCPVTNADGTWYNGTGVTSQNYNPVATLYENTYHSKTKTLQGVGKAALTIIDGLVWNLTGSYQNSQYHYDRYATHNSQVANYASKNGSASRGQNESTRKQLETFITFDREFKGAHKLGLMAGYSWEESNDSDGYGLTGYNFYDDSTTWYNFSLANSFNVNDIYSNVPSQLRMISFYGRVNYSYDSRYIFQATIRRDGSSAFGSNNQWGTFPSGSFAWRISQEPWMRNQKTFSDLKLRVGYGVSGNSLGFDAYIAQQRYSPSSWFDYTDSSGSARYRTIVPSGNANPDLKWERTAMFNIGLDFGFWDNRLTGTIEFYNKETSDLIYWYPVSTSRYPYDTMTANVGNVNNKGVELTLRATPVQRKNFSWNTSLVLSHNKNNVSKMSNDTYSTDYINMGNPNIGGFSSENIMRLQEGSPIGTFFLYEWQGYDDSGTSIYNDYDSDGNLIGTTTAPGEEDRKEAGCAQPKLTLGWDNTFRYKGWSLNAFFQGNFGNDVYNAVRNFFSNVNLANTGKNALASILTDQKAGDVNAARPSDRYLESGSFFRLSTLQLSYDFGKIGKWFNGIQIYITGNNLFTITNYSGTDPEVYLGGLTPGIDHQETRYPLTRSVLLGAKINF